MLRAVFIHIVKDARIEFRSRFALNMVLAFAAITTLSVSLSSGGIVFPPAVHGVLLWVIIFFSAMSGLAHLFTREEEEGTALFLRINSRAAVVYTAKLVFNTAVLLVVGLVVTPLYLFFLGVGVASPLFFAAIVACGCLAVAASTTLLAAITAKSGGRGSLLTILSFPIALPVLWVCIKGTTAAMVSAGGGGASNLVFLLAFSGAMTAVSYMLFEHIWVEGR